ncbi:MAG: tol-pal system-associated acyl-CoA thioesterase [Rhizobiales bacterium]|nr:tol-pal system-associated acyl-CoA thioesterase [Hyphomicrobiales bacterium]
MAEGWPDLAGRIEAGEHVLPVRVYYEDTDFSGFVYHANYLKFCERARSDCLRLLGIHHHELHWHESDGRMGFVVRRMQCDFLKPARIDDVLEVRTAMLTIKGARFELDQRVSRDGELLFHGLVMAALVDGDGRPKRMPKAILSALDKLNSN